MPELPEVQTIVNDLNQNIKNRTILSIESTFKKAIKGRSLEEINRIIKDTKIEEIIRIAKNIVFKLNNDYFLFFHLRMTGQLTTSRHCKKSKHLHHYLRLEKDYICFYDMRKFGTISLLETADLKKVFKKVGVDPTSESFTLKYFRSLIKKSSKKTIKSFLMDQRIVSGIGNIYASEILFDSKIHPSKNPSILRSSEINKVYHSIKEILEKAIEMRGTSVSDYRDGYGNKGKYQKELRVYKKNGHKCYNCDTILEKCIIEQRSTFFCPNCQI